MERYGTDRGAKQTTPALNHRARNNGEKAVEANSQKAVGPESPKNEEQRSNRDCHKAHGTSANN
eukprot:11124210-Ditylum_brightwellii.AAC.1